MDAGRCPSCGRRTLMPVHNEFNPRVLWRCSRSGECGWEVKGRAVVIPSPRVVEAQMKPKRVRFNRGPSKPGAKPSELPTMPARFHAILGVVCDHQGISLDEFCGNGRHPKVVRAREFVVQLARAMTTLSFPEIAYGMGRPNHSTIVTAHKRALDRMISPDVKAEVAHLSERVNKAVGGGCEPGPVPVS